MLNKSERAIINRESTDTGNIGLKTKNENKRNKKHNTENLLRSNMVNSEVSRKGKQFLLHIWHPSCYSYKC